MKVKTFVFIPVALLLFSLFILFQNHQKTGDFMRKDIDLCERVLITIESSKPMDARKVERLLAGKYGSVIVSEIKTMTGYGVSIELDVSVQGEDVLETLRSSGVQVDFYSVETVGPAVGMGFFTQIRNILALGFVLMTFFAFLVLKNPVPACGIAVASAANIITTLALANLLEIKMSFAGVAGLLVLIPYIANTNIVLATKVLKSKKVSFEESYKKGLKTGLTLVATITLTMVVILLLSTSKLLTNIASILIIGFLSDIFYTWIMNAGVLEILVERKGR